MVSLRIFIVVVLVGLFIEEGSCADPPPPSQAWGVNDKDSGNFFGHEQSTDENGRVTGKYYVLLADTRLMTVSYYVDGQSGFVPTITFSDPGFMQKGCGNEAVCRLT